MIEIRLLESIEEYLAAEEIQSKAWGITDGLDIVPAHLLLTVQKNAGMVMGAFERNDQESRLVGFVFGFLGMTPEGKIKHCSHMAGVLPQYQNLNLGYRLKLAQREFVLSQGLDLITWTYDPLESRNANLNISKLGCVCNTYYRNLYGDLREEINKGLPTDRFEVEWHLEHPFDTQKIPRKTKKQGLSEWMSSGAHVIAGNVAGGLIKPFSGQLNDDSDKVLIEIPSDFQVIKSLDLQTALEWRIFTRKVFEKAFSHGYWVVDFIYEAGRSFYVLDKDWNR